ncbi:carboxylesterase [Neohortaea acidophila]|uniref:Carboxylesterase n=1 Tax=Neohortaea acidophila TaxID=245834 RepID=A0A6A6PNT9_9PEZI|nr:carboxylesterase [Neohortaea acidophila]KAF2481466.1 carboxylesterase [Neohortaea acidophila]
MLLSRFSFLFLLSLTPLANSASIKRWRESETSHATVVLQNNITVHGASANGTESFLDIRFGHDTSGANRFKAPQAFQYPPNAIVNASAPGAACPQQKVPIPGLPLFDNVTNISEDCLTVRVDRPAGVSSGAKLPVMVFIYGGGDTVGQIYDGAYDPSGLILGAAQKGFPIIYAAMNYRVGVFGFAASDALRKEGSLNAGLLDQRLGLKWIQENIAAFGGDPDQVTVFGESDGATGVGLQITAYGGQGPKPPFRRAIMESGGPTADAGTASNFSAVHTAALADLLNCSSANSVPDLACLRKVPLTKLVNIAYQYEVKTEPPSGLDVFIPTAPSTFIPDSPSRLLYQGRFSKDIDIISGWNEDDGSFFVSPTIDSEAKLLEFFAFSFPNLSNATTKEVLNLYPVSQFESSATKNVSAQYFRASRIMRDAYYACPSVLMVQSNGKYSNASTANYLYVLNQTMFTSVFEEAGDAYLGVSHFSDIPFVFNQASTRYAQVSTSSDVKLSSLVSGSWAAFAAFGIPSGRNGTLTTWPRAGNSSGLEIEIIGGPDAGVQSSKEYEELQERCTFWNSPVVTQQLQV